MDTNTYDPFAAGQFTAGMRAGEAIDRARNRTFPIDIWYPTRFFREGRDLTPIPGPHPLVVYSHSSGGHRRSATFLCRHLAEHGYVVAAMDHSELVAEDLRPRDGADAGARAARIDGIINSRVPDVRFLLDHVLGRYAGAGTARDEGVEVDEARIGLAGHSFGGWTVLATAEVDRRVRAVVAMAAGGSSRPLPGILPLTLSLDWGRDIPTLYLAAENDVPIPPDRVVELFDRTPGTKRMFTLRRADHQHFVDDVEGEHEALRALTLPGEAAWIPAAMLPMSELSSGEQAHLFVRGLTLAHLDATLRELEVAEHFLGGDVAGELAVRGVELLG